MASIFLRIVLMAHLIPSLLGQLNLAAPSTDALAACHDIATQVETDAWSLVSLNSDYTTAKSHYWSSANADATPACAVFPKSAEDVSAVIDTLLQYPTVLFAVKSGGHNANVGFSSVNGGVLISFSKFNKTILSADKKTADLRPGARWEEVISALEPYGVAVVGGRVGDVGVGGLLLGCGLSFLSAQYGLPCDSIVNYEVVLANATIVNANATSNADLFWALKGGGNQFGIVTKFTMETIPISQVWGGIRTYTTTPLVSSQILNATQDFTENFSDSRAGIIVTVQILADNLDSFWALFFFYNGASPPAGVFDKFNSISSTSDTTKTQSYRALLTSNNQLASVYGLRYVLRGATVPSLPSTAGMDLLNANYNAFVSEVTTSRGIAGLLQPGFIFNLIYQPLPYCIAAASTLRNQAGNLLGLSADAGDHMWMAITVSWLTELGDNTGHSIATSILDKIKSQAQTQFAGITNSNYKVGNILEEEYSPSTFMNDAMYDQQVLQGYGNATYEKLKAVQREYDTIGFFPGRTGGFKLT